MPALRKHEHKARQRPSRLVLRLLGRARCLLGTAELHRDENRLLWYRFNMSDTTINKAGSSDVTEQELENLLQRLEHDPTARARIDALLAEAEKRGGARPSHEVFAELETKLNAHNGN